MEELVAHDRLGVAAICSALQLLPENVPHGQRLMTVSGLALNGSPSASLLPNPRLVVRWATHPGLPVSGPGWDPFEGPFADRLPFVGGDYLLLNANGDPDSVFNLRCVMWALLGSRMPLPKERFFRDMMDLTNAVLALSARLCRAAGVTRHTEAAGSDEIVVPRSSKLEALCAAVTFGCEFLDQVGVGQDALAPVVHDLDRDGPVRPNQRGLYFETRPIVRSGDRFVIAEPSSLAIALRHALVVSALSDGRREELVNSLGRGAVETTTWAIERMGWRVHQSLPSSRGPFASIFASFDLDKIAVVTVLGDELETYDKDDPVSQWPLDKWTDPLLAHLREVEVALLGQPATPNEVLHVIVLAGCGRPVVLGLAASPSPLQAPICLFSLEAIDRVGMAVDDPLLLWNYAKAQDRLRERVAVHAFGTLDEFAAWSEGQSYYMDDGPRPTFLMIATDYGKAFRTSVATRFDPHSVRSPHGSIMEVQRVDPDQNVSIYIPLWDRRSRSPQRLVECDGGPVWVIGPDLLQSSEHRRPYELMVDCVAHWLWKTSPLLDELLPQVIERPLIIELLLEDPDWWSTPRGNDPGGPVAKCILVGDRIVLTVLTAFVLRSAAEDNRAERELLHVIFEGLARIPGARALSVNERDAAIDQHAPLGPMRMFSLMSAQDDPALEQGDLAIHRRISLAATDLLLDEASEHLSATFPLPAGPVPPDQRRLVLGSVVAFHFAQLRREIAVLSPHGLLERLVRLYETAVFEEARGRRILGPRVEIFGSLSVTSDIRASHAQSTQAAIALRFLIEYVVAQPPEGIRPFSWTAYDRLLAICGQIFSRGLTSDLIHFAIEDTQLEMLESERLGLPTGTFQQGQEGFLDTFVPAHIANAAQQGGGQKESDDQWVGPTVDDLAEATAAEWGLSLRQMMEFVSELAGLAREQGGSVGIAPHAWLHDELAQRLDWPSRDVHTALRLLSLTPRTDFLTPPDEFERRDLYPWRFNRRLSYLRRPLLFRLRNGEGEYVWGLRHVQLMSRYIFDQIMLGRFQAETQPLKLFISRVRHQQAQDFVDTVASVAATRAAKVATNVRRIQGRKLSRANKEDLGDVDVLAADTSKRILFALECKSLAGARTPAELRNEIDDIFRADRASSSAQVHVERADWLRANIPSALAHLKIRSPSRHWTVAAAIVVAFPVLSPHIADCPLPVVTLAELPAFLTAEQTP